MFSFFMKTYCNSSVDIFFTLRNRFEKMKHITNSFSFLYYLYGSYVISIKIILLMLQMQGMMHHGQQFNNSYNNQRSHGGPGMHQSMNGMNGMSMMGQNSGPMHGNMMPSGVMGPGSNMNKLVMQVSE